MALIKTPGITLNALELIKHFESLHDGDLSHIGLQPKMDPIGIWTVGYGHALRHPKNPNKFLRGSADKKLAYDIMPKLTEDDAEMLLKTDLLSDYLPITLSKIPPEAMERLNSEQLGALVSFVYNAGTGYKNVWGKTVPFAMWNNLKRLYTRNDPPYTNQNFKDYWEHSVIMAGGRVLPGLQRRRKAEYWLFKYGTLNFNP